MDKLKMRIKYFEGATKLKKITKGNWIDVYARKDMFIPLGERAMIPLGFALELPQGWEGHLAPRSSTFKTWGIIQTNSVGVVDDTYIGDNDEWHMPVYCLKSNRMKIDNVEEGCVIKDWLESDNFKECCKEDDIRDILISISLHKSEIDNNGNFGIKDSINNTRVINFTKTNNNDSIFFKEGTWIRKGDKIGQFRVMEIMPEIEFDEVESFGNEDRGGFGTTGVK